MNFNGAWDDVSTLAHESGHSMHSFLSSANQPYATADYSTFVAEVASTLNENLLFHHMLADHAGRPRRGCSCSSSYLDNMRTTLFRQTLFAEFELKIHESRRTRRAAHRRVARASCTWSCCASTTATTRASCTVDERYAAEWAYIPHFYYNFYVYQYATSLIGGMSLADGIIGRRR